MKQLLYISTARAPIDDAALADILEVSRRNNARDAITGLLVAGGRRFIQVLEGPEAAIDAAYARIAADPRHFATVVIAQGTVTQRSFGGWAMGFQRGGDSARARQARDVIGAMIAPITDPTLRAYFAGFADLHARAA